MSKASTPRMFTCDEVREQFLMHVAALVQYWDELKIGIPVRERLEGLAHSILVALDGNAAALPGFVVAPAPHPTDRAYCIRIGENFYPEAPNVACDIAGELHERIYAHLKQGPPQ